MARLCDIVKENIACNVKKYGTKFVWDGMCLNYPNGNNAFVTAGTLFSNDWHLDEPTVADLLRERGYRLVNEHMPIVAITRMDRSDPSLYCRAVTSPAEATRICDFLDSLHAGGGTDGTHPDMPPIGRRN